MIKAVDMQDGMNLFRRNTFVYQGKLNRYHLFKFYLEIITLGLEFDT